MGGRVRVGQLMSHQRGWITSKTNSTWKAACRQQSRASLMCLEPEALFSKWVDAFWANFIYPNGVRAIVNCLVKLWSQSNPGLRRAGNKRLHNTKQAVLQEQVMAAPALQRTFLTLQATQPAWASRAQEDTVSIWSEATSARLLQLSLSLTRGKSLSAGCQKNWLGLLHAAVKQSSLPQPPVPWLLSFFLHVSPKGRGSL